MQIHIWVRRTVDWEDKEAFDAQVSEFMRPRAALWNSTLDMPFHLFRGKVRDIARVSLEATGLPITTDWASIPEGDFVLPVDDDDWFDPAVGDRLAPQLGEALDGAYWHSSWVEVASLRHRFYLLRRRYLPRWTPAWWMTTNNYVLRRLPRLQEMAIDHVRASRWLVEEPQRIKWIDARISIANRNLGSQTSLGSQGSQGPLDQLPSRGSSSRSTVAISGSTGVRSIASSPGAAHTSSAWTS